MPMPIIEVQGLPKIYRVAEKRPGLGGALRNLFRRTHKEVHAIADCASAGGTAVAGTDYTPVSGTLTFAPGQTSATFSVPLLDDALTGEASPETVSLALSARAGATLGSASSATLNIGEDSGLSWIGTPIFTWTQSPTPPPVVTNPGAQTSAEGAAVSLQIAATDPNGYSLSYAAVNLPTGLSINSTGLIAGTTRPPRPSRATTR